MYKAAGLVAVLAAALAYLVYPHTQAFLDQLSTVNFITTHKPETMQSISRQVIKKVLAVETEEASAHPLHARMRYSSKLECLQGAGALVRRSIGSMKLRNLTPFLMLDHFHVSQGAVRIVRSVWRGRC